MTKTEKARFDALKVAASAIALTIGAGLGSQASAQSAASYAGSPGSNLDIVANDTVPLGPGAPLPFGTAYANSPNILDAPGVNGVGQQIMFAQTGPTTAGLLLCSGTLINPRTVITAAHCVYNNPAHKYGADTGTGGGVNGPFGTGGAVVTSTGIPLSFGFSSTNRCIAPTAAFPTGNGCAVGAGPYEVWRDSGFNTQVALNIFNANQVWYNTNAQPVALGGGGEFANGDIALITLDTHAAGIPTWTMLFSQLDGPTHATITGYGGTGVGLPGIGSFAGIDYRRRSAENMIDALMTNNDWVDSPAINPGNTAFAAHQHPIYWMDFDDPHFTNVFNPATWCINTAPPGGRNNAYCDMNGLGGLALVNEGATAGGDSGGPLVVDQRFERPVVAGVLTGSWWFNGGISTYGQFNVYPPLFQFWEQIVTNNPYVYAGNRHGNRDWTNPNHWVQLMDPNYGIIGADGELANSLPNTHEGGGDGAVDKFGTLCFFGVDCTTFDGPGGPTGTGGPLVIPGGPGSTGFVPNNVEPINSATPGATVRARYYDVILSGIGETRVTSPITIDRLTVDGLFTSLDVRSTGTLNIWTDATFAIGRVNVDGRINAGEAVLIDALLTGRGTFNPSYLTSVNGAITPGGLGDVRTLTVQGDVILASESELLVELGRSSGDQLRITADPAQGTTGIISLGGDLWLTPYLPGGGPRHGNSYTVVAAPSVVGTFEDVNGFLGILRPKVTYTATTVRVELKAGSFWDLLLHHPDLAPIAYVLDQLREHHYADLYDLYGAIDLMDATSLTRTFGSLRPQALLDANALIAMQGSQFGDTLGDRLSLLSRGGGAGFTVMGSPSQVLAFGGDEGLSAAGQLAFASRLTESSHVADMPNGLSAFFTGGYDENRASAISGRSATTPDDGMRTWHMIGGIEQSFGAFTLGFAGGYSRGEAFQLTGAQAENEVSQAAVYGVYSFENGAYVSGMIGAGSSRVSTERRLNEGMLDYRMAGDINGEIFLASVETGVNLDVFEGYTLTPHVALRQYSVSMEGFSESGGQAALDVSDQEYNRLEARLGARLAGDHTFMSGWRFVPSLDAAAVANLAGDEGGVWARFAAAPDASFFLPGGARDDYWGEVAGGLSLVRGDTSFALRMETNVGREELHEDRYTARFVQRF